MAEQRQQRTEKRQQKADREFIKLLLEYQQKSLEQQEKSDKISRVEDSDIALVQKCLITPQSRTITLLSILAGTEIYLISTEVHGRTGKKLVCLTANWYLRNTTNMSTSYYHGKPKRHLLTKPLYC